MAREQTHGGTVPAHDQATAVVLDLVHPVRPGGRLDGECGDAGSNEPVIKKPSRPNDQPVMRPTFTSSAPISFVPEPMEADPQTIEQTWICLTPCHSGLSPDHDPRGRFAPGHLNKGKTDSANNM
jgi:hypothetical protein